MAEGSKEGGVISPYGLTVEELQELGD